MKVTLFMAMSANGIVARNNGSEDFLSHENWLVFREFAEKYDNFIYGRKTYEAVKKWGKKYNMEKFVDAPVVVSRHLKRVDSKKNIYAASPHDALKKLKERGFKTALLSGGPTLNSAFAKAGLINKIFVAIQPIIVGEGKPLFLPTPFDLPLKLQSTEKRKGLLILSYEVLKNN